MTCAPAAVPAFADCVAIVLSSMSRKNGMWNRGSIATSAVPVRSQEDTSAVPTCCIPDDGEVELLREASPNSLTTTLESAAAVGLDDVCRAACRALQHGAWNAESRITLCLARALDVPEPCQVVGDRETPEHFAFSGLSLGFGLDDLRRLCLADIDFATVEQVLSGCDEPTRGWFRQQMPVTTCELETNLVCFTDGSFTPAGAGLPAYAGWALAIFRVDKSNGSLSESYGVVSGQILEGFLLPGEEPNAFLAECCALCVAAYVAVVALPTQELTFVSDCLAALACADGSHSTGLSHAQGILRSMHRFRSASSVGRLYYVHTHSHVGEWANEVVHQASKQASKGRALGGLPPLDARLWFADRGMRLTWAALVCRRLQGDVDLPPVVGENLGDDLNLAGMTPRMILDPFLSMPLEETRHVSLMPGRLQVRIASCNVLTLACGTAGKQGKARESGLALQVARPYMFAKSLESACLQAVCVQESRCESGVVHTGGFLRFCSGHEAGSFGTEWWFREGHCLVKHGGSVQADVRFSKKHFCVKHADPRRMFVLFACTGLKLLFVGLHAPHRAHELHLIQDWWTETGRLCAEHGKDMSLIIAGDFNASLGGHVSRHVGGHDPEHQDFAGDCVHAMLEQTNCWLPSSFQEHHSGQSWTYVHKRGDVTMRMDFVALPWEWRHGAVCSWVAPEVHTGQAILDHLAVCCDVDAPVGPCSGHSACGRKKLDEQAIMDPANRGKVREIINATPAVPWHISAHAHASIVVQHLQTHLGKAFPAKPRSKSHHFLSADALALRAEVTRARRDCCRLRKHVKNQMMSVVFNFWKSRGAGPDVLDFLQSPWHVQARFVGVCSASRLRCLSQKLRERCHVDRATFVESLALQMDSGDSGPAYAALHRLLGHRRKKPYAIEVLPVLKKKDGSMCADADQIRLRWREHFSDLEAGTEVSPDTLLNIVMRPKAWTLPASLDLLPTEVEIANALTEAKAGKAPGSDTLPHGLGRACPVELARMLQPLSLGA